MVIYKWFQVELTWDETDPGRAEVLNRKFSKEDLEKMDLHDYLASSSDEEGQLISRLLFTWFMICILPAEYSNVLPFITYSILNSSCFS